MSFIINRTRRTLSGTQHIIVGTRDWANRFEKNSNQSLTSLTLIKGRIFLIIDLNLKRPENVRKRKRKVFLCLF